MWLSNARWIEAEILGEPVQSIDVRLTSGRWVVRLPRVIVEGVQRLGINVDLVCRARGIHGLLDRRNPRIDVLIELAIDGENRSLDIGHTFQRRVRAVER